MLIAANRITNPSAVPQEDFSHLIGASLCKLSPWLNLSADPNTHSLLAHEPRQFTPRPEALNLPTQPLETLLWRVRVIGSTFVRLEINDGELSL